MTEQNLPEFKKEASELVDQSKALMNVQNNRRFILKDEEQRERAAILLKEAHALEKKIKAHYKPIEDAHRETGRKIRVAKTEQLTGPVEAKRILSQGIGEYDAKAQREAEEKARIERERIEKERLAEAERKQKEAEVLKAKGTSESMQQALNLESEAEKIIDMPDPVVKVKQPEKLSGIKQRRYVKCEIQDAEKLTSYLVQQGLSELLLPNESVIRNLVKQRDGKIDMPGLRVWEEFKATT
jgi:hypothetical protein